MSLFIVYFFLFAPKVSSPLSVIFNLFLIWSKVRATSSSKKFTGTSVLWILYKSQDTPKWQGTVSCADTQMDTGFNINVSHQSVTCPPQWSPGPPSCVPKQPPDPSRPCATPNDQHCYSQNHSQNAATWPQGCRGLLRSHGHHMMIVQPCATSEWQG